MHVAFSRESTLRMRHNGMPEASAFDRRGFWHLSMQVTCGYASDALTQFLSTGLTEVQLARMRKGVETGTGQVIVAYQLRVGKSPQDWVHDSHDNLRSVAVLVISWRYLKPCSWRGV